LLQKLYKMHRVREEVEYIEVVVSLLIFIIAIRVVK
jgi:hypothetical protein